VLTRSWVAVVAGSPVARWGRAVFLSFEHMTRSDPSDPGWCFGRVRGAQPGGPSGPKRWREEPYRKRAKPAAALAWAGSSRREGLHTNLLPKLEELGPASSPSLLQRRSRWVGGRQQTPLPWEAPLVSTAVGNVSWPCCSPRCSPDDWRPSGFNAGPFLPAQCPHFAVSPSPAESED